MKSINIRVTRYVHATLYASRGLPDRPIARVAPLARSPARVGLQTE
jgi:hypothetical protein